MRLGRDAVIRGGVTLIGVLVAWWIGAACLPNGLPFGVVLYGLVLGALSSLVAIGLVLIYRASRVINFAQAEIGGLAATVAVIMVAGWRLPYVLAVPVGLAVALATGWLIDATVIRRFFTAPRLILTVATIGLAQLLGAGELELPTLVTNLRPLSTFTTPFSARFRIGPVVFDGNSVVALVAVPVVLGAMYWFLSRSEIGLAIRAAADSQERSVLLGIPVRKLSRYTWVLAAGLSGLASLLSAPIVGPDLGAISGPEALLVPLTAAVVARMESLPVTVAAALGIGVFEQAVFWSYPRSTTVDVFLFVVVVAALLLQRRRYTRVDDGGLGGYVAVREVRRIPDVLSVLPEVRYARWFVWAVVGGVAVLLPATFADSTLDLWAFFAIYGILAVSLVVLTGWAGQVSLGQFAFAGVGAATTGALLVHLHADLWLALGASALVGAGAAAIIGIPALRIPGPFLAVTTLAFGVPVATYLLNSANFPSLTPAVIQRPMLWGRFDLDNRLLWYYFCLAFLCLSLFLARNYRLSRAGRVVIATRENQRAAASYSVSPLRAKLAAFAFSGSLAGVAGGLYAIGLNGIPFSGFDPNGSLVIFTMVVIGGLGSLTGGVVGAIYVAAAQDYLHGAAELLATGAGLLVLLMIVPGGIGEILFALRDRALRLVAIRRNLPVHGLNGMADEEIDIRPAPIESTAEGSLEAVPAAGSLPLLECRTVEAGYGQVQVLFGVDIAIQDGEVAALLGTNGAGKSTLLRVVAGLLPARTGSVVFDGRDLSRLAAAERVAAGIVMVPGGRGVFGSLTVAENLHLAGWLARRTGADTDDLMRQVHDLFPVLWERAEQKAALLSGGEQQMLTIAQALLCRPRLLLIDELSLGLAPAVVAQLLDVVRGLNASGITVVVVEQSVNVATELADRAVFMEKGAVRFTGRTVDLHHRADLLRSVFLGPARKRPARPAVPAFTTPEQNGQEPASVRPVLEVDGISRRFRGVTAVDGVSLHVAPGEILGIIGSNGAGKTTLFDLVSGFLPADSGTVRLDGEDVSVFGAPGRAERGLGRMFQDARLFPSLTVEETISIALERHIEVRDPFACIAHLGAATDSEEDVRTRADELIERMGLARFKGAFVSELSTGTRRIVDLACALAHQPSVLLLDEPSSGIAQRESEALAEVLLDIRSTTGAALIVIEHDVPLVASIADRMMCLHLGRVLSEGQPAAVLADPAVVASYLGEDQAAISRSAGAHQKALSTAEYASESGLSVEMVRRLIRRGELPARRGPKGYVIETAKSAVKG